MADMIGLKIVGVDEGRISDFNALISPDMAEAVTMPETYAIGALCPGEKAGEYHPAGIVIFSVCREEEDRRPVAVEINWLYVEEELRRMGIGKRLVAETAVAFAGTVIRILRCDMSPMAAKKYGVFFASRGFRAHETFGWQIGGTVGSLISKASPLGRESMNVKKLSALNVDVVKAAMERIFAGCGVFGADRLISMVEEWFDMDISRMVVSGGRIGMMLLIHRKPSGILQALLLREKEARSADQDTCVLEALEAARSEYGFNARVEFDCGRGADILYLSELFPNCGVQQLRRMVTDITAI